MGLSVAKYEGHRFCTSCGIQTTENRVELPADLNSRDRIQTIRDSKLNETFF